MLLCSVLMEEEGIRLQKFLAERGVASRRKCAEHILAGRVRVNGRVVREPGFRVDAEDDGVSFDRHKLGPQREVCRTILMNKPRGYICSAVAGQGRTVYELLGDSIDERLVPVGRLDKNSEGLLLLSNDGNLINRLTHPRFRQEKTYHITVSGALDRRAMQKLRSRLIIDGYRIHPVAVRILRKDEDSRRVVLEFILMEGRKRQIRKMCEAAGLKVHRLVRVGIRTLSLRGLRPGKWRNLTAGELASLT